MKKFKTVACAVLATVMAAIPLAGCNGGGKRQANFDATMQKITEKFTGDIEEGTARRPIRLRVLDNDTAKKTGYFTELLNAFNAKYKDKYIEAVDANGDQYIDLANDGPYGYGPDVLYQANDALMRYCDGKHIVPLPANLVEAYDYLPDAAKQAYTYNYMGNDYFMAIPVNVQAPMLFYRKDLLPENWKTEWDDNKNEVPDMLEDWRAMYRFSIWRKANSNNAQYGFMQSLSDQYFTCGYIFSYGAYVFGENNTDPTDIGIAAGDAEKGGRVIWQLSSIMNSGCIDDSITVDRDSKLANGTYFATVSTPDTYSAMRTAMITEMEKTMSTADATAYTDENFIMTTMPQLPLSGDLAETEGELIDQHLMGGIQAYAVSSYTRYPRAALAFVNFATSYEQIMRRNELMGIAPARSDASAAATVNSEVSRKLYDYMESGVIDVMPSISEVAQIWTPITTAFTDIANDPYRDANRRKYVDGAGNFKMSVFKSLFEKTSSDIFDAIYLLA